MRRLFIILVVILICSPAAGDTPLRILYWDNTSVTFELTTAQPRITPLEERETPISDVEVPGMINYTSEGRPVLPVERFVFGVPDDEGVQIKIVERDIEKLEGVLPRLYHDGAFDPEKQRELLLSGDMELEDRFVRLGGTRVFRKRHLAMVDFRPVLFDQKNTCLIRARRLVVQLSFPHPSVNVIRGTLSGRASLVETPSGRSSLGRTPGKTSPGKTPLFWGHLMANSEQASRWSLPEKRPSQRQRSPFEFDLSDNWVKLSIRETGMYVITHNDLLSLDINPSEINPATMRLFSAGPFEQPDSISDGGSFEDSYHMTEHSMLFTGSGSEFIPTDSLIFYGVGPKGWLDYVNPSARWSKRYEHTYSNVSVYWLTWGVGFPGECKRMGSRNVTPSGSPDTTVVSFRRRIHFEQDNKYDPTHTDDRWFWELVKGGAESSFSHDFNLPGIIASDGIIRTQCYGRIFDMDVPKKTLSSVCYINGALSDTIYWDIYRNLHYLPEEMTIMEAEVSNLNPGENNFYLDFLSDRSNEEMMVLWFDVFFHHSLSANEGMLDFFSPVYQGKTLFSAEGLSTTPPYIFDVTDHTDPTRLKEFSLNGGTLEWEDNLTGSRHYMAISPGSLRKPSIEIGGSPSDPLPSLRDSEECPDMLIIHHSKFRDAASTLASHRSSSIAGIQNPLVWSLDVEDVFNNFSGGMKDPIAIRNYLKFLYENYNDDGDPKLKYVLLIGNGNYDYLNRTGKGTDFIPYYINRIKRYYLTESQGIEDEDFLVKLDDREDDCPDMAIGRLIPVTSREANTWVNQITRYEGDIDPGDWRNKVILLADDEYSTYTDHEFTHLEDTERMSGRNGQFPWLVDFKKIYLHDYPFVGNSKPGAKNDLIKEWNQGALIVNYVGHGGRQQLADERVMLNSDIYSLTNGYRRPLFMGLSCEVGDLDDPYSRSFSQVLVTSERGGAIASISGAAPTKGWSNIALGQSIYDHLFTSKDSTGTIPIGYAYQLGKISTYKVAYNNTKYALLGDPAMSLAYPEYRVIHNISEIDTLATGYPCTIRGEVRLNGEVLTSFDGIADLEVFEARKNIEETISWKVDTVTITKNIKYYLPGEPIFRGTVDVQEGEFGIDLMIPVRCRTGNGARIRSYVYSSTADGVGAIDTVTIVRPDSIPENSDAPQLRMYFAGQATRVKPGAILISEISDSDGIALLGTEPKNSIYLQFDQSSYPIFVTEYFQYDHGSSTSGKIEYPLPSGFSNGPHSVVLSAFDNLGASSSDTLRFEIVDENIYTVSDVFNFPNPFSESTNFVFQLSSRGRVSLKIYNLSGVLIWEKDINAQEGFNSINWRGCDFTGDGIANGTYVYLLDVDFTDSFHRSEQVKGTVVLLR
jgi:hypothetical protein